MKGRKFPVQVRNNTNMIRYVGSVRFASGEIKTIDKVAYNRNQKQFDEGLETLVADDLYALEIVTKAEKKKQEEEQRAEEEANTSTDEPSTIKLYADRHLHWSQAIKKLDEIKTQEEAKEMYKEGLELNLAKDSAVMKSLKSIIEGFNTFS